MINNKIVRFFLCIFPFCFLALVCKAEDINSIKSKGYMTMGTSADFPPFDFFKEGKIIGIDSDISKRIAESLGLELKIKDISFNALITELKNGNIDFIAAGLTKTAERAESIDFSDSYFTASQRLLVKSDSLVSRLEDIDGKKVGVQLGTTADSYCTDDLENIEIMRYDKATDAIAALSSGIIDIVVMDDFSANQVVKKNKNLRLIDGNLTEESYCIGVRKGNLILLRFINETISEMKHNGEIERIVSSYMNIPEDVENSNTSKASEFLKREYIQYIFNGLTVTLEVTFFATLLGVALGTFASSLRIISETNKHLKIFDMLVSLYTTIVRGTPVIVQLFIIYYVVLSGISKSPIVAAIMTLGINSGAYVCEHIRAGIEAIDKGQFEAGKSLGLSEGTLMSRIIIPQAIKNILPSLAGEAISLLKETAAVGFIGVMDLSLAGKKITSITFDPVLPLFAVAVIYLVLVVGLTFILRKIERKMKNASN